MKLRYTPDPVRFESMSTAEIRESFLLDELFRSDAVALVATDLDRALVGSAVPATKPLSLDSPAELRSRFFCERRELGVLNIGGPGSVTVDGQRFELDRLDALYVGRGSEGVAFDSDSPARPARYYLLSFPAHAPHPTVRIRSTEAETVKLGSAERANRRTLYKLIHAGGARSCQLVMGFTVLEPGSVWNSVPPHTHARRMEVYLYFDLPEDARLFHFLGRPEATRHIVVADGEAVLAPGWSIHCGAGTAAYAFCWGMGGENQAFDDMDPVAVAELE
jgi:4-deoxy-L-threo-5-hexosulose-uronate ketol-isomerase